MLFKSDFEPISLKFSQKENIIIYPISDIHSGSKEFMTAAWTKFTNKILMEPNSYITLSGDLMNNSVKNSISNIYEDILTPNEQKYWLTEQLRPIKNKILCLLPGNHEYRSVKEVDNNPLLDIANQLDITDRYRSSAAFIYLTFGKKSKVNYTLCVIHGSGGGILTGAGINRNERFSNIIEGLDILIVGHNHKAAITKPQKIILDAKNDKVLFHPYFVISATAWLDYGGYALKKQMLPTTGGALQEIHLNCLEKNIRVIF